METANTPQGTGQPMTMEEGLARFKAKTAEKGVKIDDVVAPLDENGFEATETPAEEPVDTAESEENTETVSEGKSEPEAEEILSSNAKIILQDGSTITAEEARKGYLRQADFTRKTQDLAQLRDQQTAQYQAKVKDLEGLHQQLASLQEQEPDWLALAQDPNVDPKQLQASQAYWQRKKAVATQAQQEIANARAMAVRTAKAEAYKVLNSGEYNKAWTDPKELSKGLDAVAGYMMDKYGYGDSFIANITDPNIIVAFDKARQLDELKAQKPKAVLAVKGKPAPFKPGAKSTASPQSENLRALTEAFRSNPTIENATRLEQAKSASRR